MVNYQNELFAVHGVNQFLWNKLQQLDCMKPEYYVSASGKNQFTWIPIMPTQQVEEFTQATDVDKVKAPFIVYNWRAETVNQNWFVQSDQIVYVIYGDDDQNLRDATKLIVDTLKRWDDSAVEVNNYVSQMSSFSRYKQFHYKSTSILSASGPEPASEPGGRMQSIINFRITYTDDSIYRL